MTTTARGRMMYPLVTGDYVSVKPWGLIPKKGTAVSGRALFDDGEHLGKVCRPLTYIVGPVGDELRIYYTREETS